MWYTAYVTEGLKASLNWLELRWLEDISWRTVSAKLTLRYEIKCYIHGSVVFCILALSASSIHLIIGLSTIYLLLALAVFWAQVQLEETRYSKGLRRGGNV
jgi:hypothetical protein